TVDGFWASDPTVANSQWAEVLIINGPRLPVNGRDITANDADVILIYKNHTWANPGGWSGEMAQTSPAANHRAFTAADEVATIILKSGNIAGRSAGTRYDNIAVVGVSSPPPDDNHNPAAQAVVQPTTGQAPLTVSFDGSGSFDPDGDSLQFRWDFGDGQQATDAVTSHTYAAAGVYQAVLTVEDARGGADSVIISIEVTGQVPPGGPNLVTNPGFEDNFNDGLAAGWLAWTGDGQGYWKPSSRLGRIGSGSYAGGGEVVQAVKRLNPKVILLEGNALGMAAELRSTFADALMIGRIYFDDLYSQYLSDPERYGRILAERCIALNRPEIDVWQGINEPYVNDLESARIAARFDKAFSDRIQELGKKSVVLNLAVGNPGDMEMMLLPEIVDLLATADYVGYHSYGGIDDLLLIGPQTPYFALRWRFYADMYAARGLRMPPVIYTEANTFYQWKRSATT
ncbi:MAG: PKD domain-containing protein, partial [Planctomycetota bacterium]